MDNLKRNNLVRSYYGVWNDAFVEDIVEVEDVSGVFDWFKNIGKNIGKGTKKAMDAAAKLVTKPIKFVFTKAWLVARIPLFVRVGMLAVEKARQRGKKVQTKKDVEEVLKSDKEFLAKVEDEAKKSKLEAAGGKKGIGLSPEIAEAVESPLAPAIIAAIISAVASLIIKAIDTFQQKKEAGKSREAAMTETLSELPSTPEYQNFLQELKMDPKQPGGGALAEETMTPSQGFKDWLSQYWYLPAIGGGVILLTILLVATAGKKREAAPVYMPPYYPPYPLYPGR